MRIRQVTLIGVSLLTVAITSQAARAQPSGDDPLVDSLDFKVMQFFDAVILKEVETGLNELLAGSQLLKQKEQISTLISKTQDLEKRFGTFRNYERVGARRVGQDLVLLRYLYKCEQFPVVWYVSYYRDFNRGDPDDADNWRVIAIRFDTDLEVLAK
jgi:hypothetical protein